MSGRGRLLAVGVALLAVACAPVDLKKLPRMGMDFAFDPKNRCAGVSPRIQLNNVPPGVVTYDVKMTDLDLISFRHWDQVIPATGPVIREGIGTNYFGPCPPSGTHRYQITVIARDAQKQPLAYGEKTLVSGR